MYYYCFADRTFSSKRECEPYLCTILHKCRAIDDIESYITQSLTQLLKPKLNLSPTVKKVRLPLRHSQSEGVLRIPEADAQQPEVKLAISNIVKDKLAASAGEEASGKKSELKDGTEEISSTVCDVSAELHDDVTSGDAVPALKLDDVTEEGDETTESRGDKTMTSQTSSRESISTERNEAKRNSQKAVAPKFGYTQARKGESGSLLADGSQHRLAHHSVPLYASRHANLDHVEIETITDINTFLRNAKMASAGAHLTPVAVSGKPPAGRKYGIVKRQLHAANVSFAPEVESVYYNGVPRSSLFNGSAGAKARQRFEQVRSLIPAIASSTRLNPRENSTVVTSAADVTDPKSQYVFQNGASPDFDAATGDDVTSLEGAQKRSALTSAIARKYGLLKAGSPADLKPTHRLLRTPSGKTSQSLPASLSKAERTSIVELSRNDSGNFIISSARGPYFPIGELLPAADSSMRNSMPVRTRRTSEATETRVNNAPNRDAKEGGTPAKKPGIEPTTVLM